ncbi:hypothetical protein [Aquimarina sp. 2304DJ70-9]|uniref:hypothetical protein n=1 Tax=Aquimarina penaris TaxID=3231044 RepID=UPI0034621A7C
MNFLFKTLDFFRLFKVRSLGNVNYQNILIVGLLVGWILYQGLERNWIPIELLLTIVVITSIISTLVFKKFYKIKLGLKWSLFHNLGIGLIVAFVFMESNDFLSSEPVITKEYYISDLSLVHGTKQNGRRRSSVLNPRISIEFDGIIKKNTLHHSRSKNAIHTRKAIVGIKRGFWNYNVVKTLRLENEE